MPSKRIESNIEVVASDLRALLFWATIGVSESRSGSYRDIINILESYAAHIKFALPRKPVRFKP